MIPVVGVPILNGEHYLQACLRSINEPVGKVVVVDNGNVVKDPGAPLTLIRPGHNLGVAASWNLIMKATPWASHWLILNHDVTLGPGDLRMVDELVRPDEAAVYHLLGWAAFVMTAPALDRLGYFDENFHPAYDEDVDMSYRARLAGVPRYTLEGGVLHVGSATIYLNDGALRQKNHRTHGANDEYYERKWGGPKHEERFLTPFGLGGSVRDWVLEPGRLRQQDWGLRP